jgi:protein-S-isoprenylcysteine O-methyltransferase Ste14
MIVSFATLDPDLLRERMRPGGKKPPLALKIFSLVLFMHWIVAGLDRGRFHWSDDVPHWLQGVCLLTVAAGYALALWAMRVNRFFSSVIRIHACNDLLVAAARRCTNGGVGGSPLFMGERCPVLAPSGHPNGV